MKEAERTTKVREIDSHTRMGTVLSVRGSVVDARFAVNLPHLHNRIDAGLQGHAVIEVRAHLSNDIVRGIALTMAEYFRDREQKDVLLLVDNVFRFIQAGSEVSGLMGQLPSRLGYQPTLGTELAELEERIASTPEGAITSIQAVYVPADDFTDPAAVHTFTHLPASIVLARKRAGEGFYPAIDPLQSNSNMLAPDIVGERHYRVASEVRKTLATYEELKDMIAMLGLEELSKADRAIVFRARRLERFLTQPFFTTEAFTGHVGRWVTREEVIDGCERILADEFSRTPERDLYLIGSIGEVRTP